MGIHGISRTNHAELAKMHPTADLRPTKNFYLWIRALSPLQSGGHPWGSCELDLPELEVSGSNSATT